jgi:hypothetical protein
MLNENFSLSTKVLVSISSWNLYPQHISISLYLDRALTTHRHQHRPPSESSVLTDHELPVSDSRTHSPCFLPGFHSLVTVLITYVHGTSISASTK